MGGLGPLASAEFLKTIYQHAPATREQEMPVVFMHSDPTFPDRTEALLTGTGVQEIADRLQQALTNLLALDVSRVVICCITLHHWLPMLPAEHRSKIVSLVDIILDELARHPGPHLLLCTSGTRRVQIFQRQPGWAGVAERVSLPDEEDQQQVHSLIYRLKENYAPELGRELLDRLAAKYRVARFIAGCTEMHLLAKHCAAAPGRATPHVFVDPLTIVARTLAQDLYR